MVYQVHKRHFAHTLNIMKLRLASLLIHSKDLIYIKAARFSASPEQSMFQAGIQPKPSKTPNFQAACSKPR